VNLFEFLGSFETWLLQRFILALCFEGEGVYNTVRPHQALGYVTPLKFLEEWTVVTAGDKNVRKGGCVTNHMNEYTYLFEA
jgi:hypothetical protein